jgi:hypothetical protein
MRKRLQSSSSDSPCSRLVTVFPTASLHAEVHFTFLPERTHFNPYQKAAIGMGFSTRSPVKCM